MTSSIMSRLRGVGGTFFNYVDKTRWVGKIELTQHYTRLNNNHPKFSHIKLKKNNKSPGNGITESVKS